MLKLNRVTKVKVLFIVLVYVFNFNLVEFSATILGKGLLSLWKTVETGLKSHHFVENGGNWSGSAPAVFVNEIFTVKT